MFPSASLMLLLNFCRGKTPWGKPVFDAVIEVLAYFGQTFFTAQIVGANKPSEVTDDDAIAAIETLVNANPDVDGHPIAGVSPFVIAIILKFALQILLKKISG